MSRGAVTIAGDHARDATERAWLLRRKLADQASRVTGAATGNIVNATISVLLFAQSGSFGFIAILFMLLLVLTAWRVSTARRIMRTRRHLQKLIVLRREVIVNATALGALWGAAVAAMFGSGNLQHQVFAGIIGSGMIGAGIISYRSIAAAARGYAFACAAGGLTGLLLAGHDAAHAAAGLLACYLGVLFFNIKQNTEGFDTICQREREVERSRSTIALLLHEYTEQASDWLIEVDRNGMIVNPGARLAEAARRPLETLEGKEFISLFEPGDELSALRGHARAGRPFRNHVVSLIAGGEQRWWSISGRPVRDRHIRYRGVITDITAQRQAEEKVSYMAHYDSLTDLPNRFYFNEHLYRALRRDKAAGLLYLDLDNFKSVNDTLGHGAGDQLLKEVARRIERSLSRREVLARLGGDEFAVIVPARRLPMIEKLAARIIRTMHAQIDLGGQNVVVGVTIGIACAPKDGADPEMLIRNADLALYAAKALGRNRALRFESGMDEAARERRLLETDLRGALANGEMRVHYQPLVSLENGRTTGYEALIRWEHPERGVVMPGQFIAVAEETGLIVQLGEWVLRQALKDASSWPDDISVSINLSPVQMRSPTLIATAINALAQTGVDPRRVYLEITETVLMQDSDANIDTLHRLREIGVRIALDDFGTGYSSLSYLRSFPFDKIKIDQCFIRDIDLREDCQAIVRSVVGLASNLGISSTAEGVERPEQAAQLKIEGCGEVQGFLYSKAVPFEQLSDLRRPKSGQFSVPVAFGDLPAEEKRRGYA